MKTKLILASALTALTLAAPAFAGHDGANVKDKFEAADANSDGALTPTEWKAAGWDSDKWATVDANKDGKVTLAEKEAAHAKMNADKHS